MSKAILRAPLLFALSLLSAACAAGRVQARRAEAGCRPFIPEAQRAFLLPDGLLEAVALTESGQAGRPYPWALNMAGRAVIAPDYRTAARLLRFANGTPRRDIAIGCMQLHMQYHLADFPGPEWALDPRTNVWYGASLLAGFHTHYGSWSQAVIHYNGEGSDGGHGYLCRVAANLARIAPATGRALGMEGCAAGNPLIPWRRSSSASGWALRWRGNLIMAARRAGGIVILGDGR